VVNSTTCARERSWPSSTDLDQLRELLGGPLRAASDAVPLLGNWDLRPDVVGRGSAARPSVELADEQRIMCGALVWMPQFGCPLLDFVLAEEASIDDTGMQSFRPAFVVSFAAI